MTAEKKEKQTAEEKAPAEKAAPKKETAKKAAPKKEAAKKAAPKKEAAKKAAPKKETAKKAAPKKETAKQAAPEKAAPKKPAASKGLLKITQVKSQIGFDGRQKKVLAGLGLGRIGRSVTRKDDACIRGMVAKVIHLVSVEELEG